MERIFLIGMPGCGKSHWGRLLAVHLGLPFTDLDEAIASGEGMSIAELFAARGEGWFRERERAYLRQVIDVPGSRVVACGGGTPCSFDNLQAMKAAGIVIYLQASPAYLFQQLQRGGARRPLLDGTIERLEELLAQREPIYTQAHHILQAQDISLATFDKIPGHV